VRRRRLARRRGIGRLSFPARGPARRIRGAAALLAALASAACRPADAPPERADPADSAVVVVDAAGRSVRFEEPPRRIVSLIPAVTAMLLALDARAELVGRTDFDTLPAVRDLPSVGNGLLPDLERLLTLRPDLVIRFHGMQDPVTGPGLDARGIPHLGVRPDRIADVREILLLVGRVTRREARARELAAQLDREVADVRARVSGRAPVRAAYVLGGDPPYVAGPGPFLAELLDIAGAENVFADLDQLYAPVSVEEVLVRAPDVLVVGRGTAVSERLRARARVLELSPDVESPSLRIGQSARELAAGLHPEAFP
jgi:ABC-type Fe3+-hydroxamate transport system substrate-binding protein